MNVKLGVLFGFIFGFIDVLLMIPLEMPNKTVAMMGAFFGRFAIGFFIPNTVLPVPFWLKGLIVGLVISFPEAIVTNAYAPILIIGGIGGTAIGIATGKLKKERR